MTNPFYNRQEGRLRAGIRIPVFLFFFIVLMGITAGIPLMGFQYLISLAVLYGFILLGFRYLDNRNGIAESGLLLSQGLWWKEFLIGSAVAFAAMTLIFFVQLVSGDIEISGFAWQQVSETWWPFPILGYFCTHLSVGFYEEFMSRSYLIPNLKEGFTVFSISPVYALVIAVVISSSIFGILHAANPNANMVAVVNIIGAGFMLAIPYVLTGRLALSVGIHFSWNFSQGGIYGFPVSGTEPIGLIDVQQGGAAWWTGGAFGPEAGLIGVLGIIFILVITLIYIRKAEGNLNIHPFFRRSYTENQQSLTNSDELA